MPLSVAIIGSGPAGFFTAEALLDTGKPVHIDILERLPTPFGLVRAGVAPDHQSTKLVSKRFEETALQDLVHFYGNVEVGRAISLALLREHYDAVVLAVGAGRDRRLGISGEHLLGVYGSTLFVGWYNGHPDFRDLDPHLQTDSAVVIGNGNVALDVARVLVKSPEEMTTSDLPDYAARAIRASRIRDVHIVGRRGAACARFTPAELRELGNLQDCDVVVDPRDLAEAGEVEDERDRRVAEKNLALLRAFTARSAETKPKRIHLRFNLAPRAIEGRETVTAVRFENRRPDAGAAAEERIACGLVVPAIGYRSEPIAGAGFDLERGLSPNRDGRIAEGLYAVGWAKRGPSGVIGSNRPDGKLCAEQIITDLAGRGEIRKQGRRALEAMLRARGVRVVTFADWLRIDAAEVAGAAGPAPRRKLTTFAEMLALLAEEGRSAAAPFIAADI